MAAEDREQTGRDLLTGDEGRDLRGDLDKTFAMGRNLQAMKCLTHGKDRAFEVSLPSFSLKSRSCNEIKKIRAS